MGKYPPILSPIHHGPRPRTDILDQANETLALTMSTSPSLQLQEDGLEPPSNGGLDPTFDETIVGYPQL